MQQTSNKSPKLNALILIGGKSQRMGSDKSVLHYHGKPQWEYLVGLLQNYVETVYISVRPKQKIAYPHIITDKEVGLGPFGAILSALETKPKEAFLVIATDLPFLDKKTIELLVKNRDVSTGATALKSKDKDYPEPLATIWEPNALPILQEFYQNKIYKPIQALKVSPIKTVLVADKIVRNINTTLDFQEFKKSKKHLPDVPLSDI